MQLQVNISIALNSIFARYGVLDKLFSDYGTTPVSLEMVDISSNTKYVL